MKIDGSIGSDLHNVPANAREAQAAGYAGVWTAETSHDPFLPPAVAERLAGDIPGATLEVLPDGRHFLPEEQPRAVADVIGRLLARD